MKRTAILSKYRTALIVLAIMAVIVVAVLGIAAAQPAPQPGGGGPGGQGPGGRGQRGMMGMRGMMGGAAIAVAGDSVFVLRGNTLYKFDAETLELMAQAELPRPAPPAP